MKSFHMNLRTRIDCSATFPIFFVGETWYLFRSRDIQQFLHHTYWISCFYDISIFPRYHSLAEISFLYFFLNSLNHLKGIFLRDSWFELWARERDFLRLLTNQCITKFCFRIYMCIPPQSKKCGWVMILCFESFFFSISVICLHRQRSSWCSMFFF